MDTPDTSASADSLDQTVPLLLVTDLARACDFYCRGLGFELDRRWEPDGELRWCWLRRNGASLMLQQACQEDRPAAPRGNGVSLYFICQDAAAVYRDLSSRGIEATPPTVAFYGMNQVFVTDLDGYALCFENPVDGN